jgi:hypothetical protein
MAYKRKTVDEYDIHASYDGGVTWDIVNCEPTWRLCRQSLREYRANEPHGQFKYEKHRVKKEPTE